MTESKTKRGIVFLNGELKGNNKFYYEYITKDDDIFCADGGAEYTFKLDIIPDLILGDLDSISQEVYNYYQKQDVRFKQFPVEKDKNDLELLLERLISQNYEKVVLFSALGKRLDHTLTNLYLLEGLFNKKTKIKIVSPKQQIEIIKSRKIIINQLGNNVSFLALSHKVTGVNLSGFKYELKDGTIKRGSSLGLSNIIKDNTAQIKIKQGTLLMIINR